MKSIAEWLNFNLYVVKVLASRMSLPFLALTGDDLDHALWEKEQQLEQSITETRVASQLCDWSDRGNIKAFLKRGRLVISGEGLKTLSLDDALELWTLCYYFGARHWEIKDPTVFSELFKAYPTLEEASEKGHSYDDISRIPSLTSDAWESVVTDVKLLATDPWEFIKSGNREQRRRRSGVLAVKATKSLHQTLASASPTTPLPGNDKEITGWLIANMLNENVTVEELASWFKQLPTECRLLIVHVQNNPAYSSKVTALSNYINQQKTEK